MDSWQKLHQKSPSGNRKEDADSLAAGAGRFRSTHWSMIRRVGGTDSGVAAEALGELCRDYWYPLYSYLRHQGHDSNAAADLTQGFFSDLLSRGDIGKADPGRGKFRSFLLASLNHFVSNQRDRQRAKKRGGDQHQFSLDMEWADSRFRAEPQTDSSPQIQFERQWALTLLEHTHKQLREEHQAKGSQARFEEFHRFLGGKSQESTISEAATRLGMNEVAAKVAIHRMRQRFGEILREQIAQTVDSEQEIEAEIQSLFEILKN